MSCPLFVVSTDMDILNTYGKFHCTLKMLFNQSFLQAGDKFSIANFIRVNGFRMNMMDVFYIFLLYTLLVLYIM